MFPMPTASAAFISIAPLLHGICTSIIRDEVVRLADLFAISGWRKLRDCHLLVRVHDEEELADDPQKSLSSRFADTFMEVKDKEMITRLIAQWKRDLYHLERIEIIGAVDIIDWEGNSEASFTRPLVFGRRFGFEKLHFTWARGTLFEHVC